MANEPKDSKFTIELEEEALRCLLMSVADAFMFYHGAYLNLSADTEPTTEHAEAMGKAVQLKEKYRNLLKSLDKMNEKFYEDSYEWEKEFDSSAQPEIPDDIADVIPIRKDDHDNN
jgi:hypothetical protein